MLDIHIIYRLGCILIAMRLIYGKTTTITIKIDGRQSELSDLVAKVEAGEDVLIAREGAPIARLTLIPARPDVAAAIENIRKSRAKLPRTTIEEILEWRDEGRRC